MRVPVYIKLLEHYIGNPPCYATDGASGMDLRAAVSDEVPVYSGHAVRIPTGLQLAIPSGFEGQVRSRSGLATRGVFVLNSPGTLDSDYRGELFVILTRVSGSPCFTVKPGERIAQLVIAPVAHAELHQIEHLPVTARGAAGLGSTGRE